MRFAYPSSFIVGAPPPSLQPGPVVRWRPFLPITIRNPQQTVFRRFTRALVDTGADQTVFPHAIFPALGLTPLPAPGQTIVWRGSSYPITYASARLVLFDGVEEWTWQTIVGFSRAPLPYVVLGQSGFLDYFDVLFSGDRRVLNIEKNTNFPP